MITLKAGGGKWKWEREGKKLCEPPPSPFQGPPFFSSQCRRQRRKRRAKSVFQLLITIGPTTFFTPIHFSLDNQTPKRKLNFPSSFPFPFLCHQVNKYSPRDSSSYRVGIIVMMLIKVFTINSILFFFFFLFISNQSNSILKCLMK